MFCGDTISIYSTDTHFNNIFYRRSVHFIIYADHTPTNALIIKVRKVLKFTLKKSSGATALQALGRQSGRRRSAKLVPTFADRGVSRGQRNGSPRPLISVYRTWIGTYFIQVAPQLTARGSRAWVRIHKHNSKNTQSTKLNWGSVDSYWITIWKRAYSFLN